MFARSRPVLLVLTIALVVAGTKFVLENLLGLDLGRLLTDSTSEPGTGTALVIVSLLVVDILLPVPSSIVMVGAGALFGVPAGAALSLVGSIGGEWLGFEVCRRYGASAARRIVGDADLDRLRVVMARHGAAAVAVSRALPVLMETTSVVAGLTHMRRSTFLLASLAGTIPIALVYAWAGAASRDAGSLVPAVVIIIAVAAGGWLWFQSRARA